MREDFHGPTSPLHVTVSTSLFLQQLTFVMTPLPFVVIYMQVVFWQRRQICFIFFKLPTLCLQSMKQISCAKTCPTLLQKTDGSGYPSTCELMFRTNIARANKETLPAKTLACENIIYYDIILLPLSEEQDVGAQGKILKCYNHILYQTKEIHLRQLDLA